MGTRALTKIKDKDGDVLVVLYRQHDGYQDGHGSDLKSFLSQKKLVNGIIHRTNDIANGMGCLAAQVVSYFKDEVGSFYIYKDGVADDWVDYIYTIYPTDSTNESTLSIKVECFGRLLFDGLVSDYPAEDIDDE